MVLVVAFASLTFIAQVFSYLFLPLLYLSGVSMSDDVYDFLNFSGLPPLLVALSAAVLLAGWLLLHRARVLEAVRGLVYR